MRKAVYVVIFLFLSPNLSQAQLQGRDTEHCERLEVVNIDYMPMSLFKKTTNEYFERIITNDNCANVSDPNQVLDRAMDLAYIIHVMNSVSNENVSSIDFTSMKDRSDIIKLAKAELKPFYRYLKRYDFEVSARNYAQLAFFSCQKFSALEFEECPKQYYDATLNSFSSKVLNEKLNSDVKSFIKKSLK